jgi:hypothetical protein
MDPSQSVRTPDNVNSPPRFGFDQTLVTPSPFICIEKIGPFVFVFMLQFAKESPVITTIKNSSSENLIAAWCTLLGRGEICSNLYSIIIIISALKILTVAYKNCH